MESLLLRRGPLAPIIEAVVVEPIRIVLEVHVVDESLTGVARATDGTTREFAGWLGLLNALGVLLSNAGQADDWDACELSKALAAAAQAAPGPMRPALADPSASVTEHAEHQHSTDGVIRSQPDAREEVNALQIVSDVSCTLSSAWTQVMGCRYREFPIVGGVGRAYHRPPNTGRAPSRRPE